MISGNHFPPNPHVWLQQKMKFSRNSLPVDRNLRLWPGNEFTLSFSLQFIFGSRKTQREREKECTLRPSQRVRERMRAPIQPPTSIYLTPVTPSSARRSPRQTPQTHGEWELKLTPIQTNAPDPTQPVDHRSSHSDHRAKHRLTVSFLEPVDRPHTHLTSDPHTSDPHTHLTCPTHPPDPPPDPISALYIYIYLFIYLFICLFI